jgi:electron transfer flavoprotein alpha subunit
MMKNIWVLPELDDSDEISKLSLGLLTEAVYIAGRVDGTVTALVFGDHTPDCSEVLRQYGVSRAYIFQDPLIQNYSADAYAAAIIDKLREESPWMFLMGHTTIGRELGPRLAALLETGLVSNCARMDLTAPDNPRFYRSVYNDQFYREVVFQSGKTMLVSMDPRVLNITPAARPIRVKIQAIEPGLSHDILRTEHLEYLPADFQTVDVTEADTIVAAGMGAVTDDLLPLVEELAGLIEGSIGTTRPVVDDGKIDRDRMIGQTGKVVSPDFYLALGISGASHHVGGIQESGKIVSVNRDPQAPVFRSSDIGAAADLVDVLPKLIARIRRAKENGEIL